jgi:hypothetical protein
MFSKKGIFLFVLAFMLILMFAGCGSDDTTNPVDKKTYVHIPFPSGTYFERVKQLEVTVTAADIAAPIIAIDSSLDGLTEATIVVTVPSGSARHFNVVGVDSLGQHLLRSQYDLTVSGSARNDLAVMLNPVGYGTLTKVKIFRDGTPWSVGPQIDSVLLNLGFTLGSGNNQYQVLASPLMGSVTLTPGTDLVIIEGGQGSSFYENYLNARSEFDDFVEQGGTLFFIAALQSQGDADSLTLPDSTRVQYHPAYENQLILDDHPITVGLAEIIPGTAASHGYLIDLPATALNLSIGVPDSITLAIYGYGKGTVIASTQPLEHLRAFRDIRPAGGSLLSRIIYYALGYDPTPEPNPRPGHLPEFSSTTAND